MSFYLKNKKNKSKFFFRSFKIEKVLKKKNKQLPNMMKNIYNHKIRMKNLMIQIKHLLKKLIIFKIENYLVCSENIYIIFQNFFFLILAEEEDPKQINKEELTPTIPNFAQYLIIGGGTTAMSAFKSIRAHDPTAKVCFYLINQLILITF
jgi:hypothetical protein